MVGREGGRKGWRLEIERLDRLDDKLDDKLDDLPRSPLI